MIVDPQLEKYPAPPIPQWLRHVMPSPEFQVRFQQDGEDRWVSNVGPQTWALLCPFDEILIGGRRGGSKSSALIAWFAMGDPDLDPDDPARTSFLNDEDFRGLVLRKEYQSLVEFVDEMRDFYAPMGVTVTDDPAIFNFPSGARIYTNHLGTKEAYEKYRGQGLTKIGVEELSQIPEERWYLKLLGSLRGKKQHRIRKVKGSDGRQTLKHFPALRCQIMSTTNPDGVGSMWVKRRFVKVEAADDTLVPWNFPMHDPFTGLTRIFIPMTLADNPYLRDNKQYMGMLLAQDEVTRAQWMEGDWDAATGKMFRSYRPTGPIGAEEREKYPWARHIPEVNPRLQPWWFRWGSLDVGYDHPAVSLKLCQNEDDRRIHVYDEFSQRRMDSYELGVLLAHWWVPELEQLPDHQIVIYVSPDAFSKTSASKTQAENLELGIKEVLGPYGALLLRYNSEERELMATNMAQAQAMFEQRRQGFSGRMGIALAMANDNRAHGCDYIHYLLRFRPALTETEEELAERLRTTYGRAGVEAYERERIKAHTSGPEVLPKIQIWSRCKELDRCLTEAVIDENKPNEYAKFNALDGEGGDDAIDAARYAVLGYKVAQTIMPKAYYLNSRMNEIQKDFVEQLGEELNDNTRLAMIARCQAARYDREHAVALKKINFPRNASMRHRLM